MKKSCHKGFSSVQSNCGNDKILVIETVIGSLRNGAVECTASLRNLSTRKLTLKNKCETVEAQMHRGSFRKQERLKSRY